MKNFFKKIANSGASPHKLSLAITLGAATAASPFWGIQTWILFPLSWWLKTNTALSITVLYLINNPWTMLPIAAADYYIGDWFLTSILRVDLTSYNPAWMNYINKKVGYYLLKYLGIAELSLWSYIIGGIILSFMVAIITYPIALVLCKKIIQKKTALS